MKKWIPACIVGVVIVLSSGVSAATVDRYVNPFLVNAGVVVSGDVESLRHSDNDTLIITEQEIGSGSGSAQVIPDHDDLYGGVDWIPGNLCGGPGYEYRCVDEFYGADDATDSILIGYGVIGGTPYKTQGVGMRDIPCVFGGVCTAQTVYVTGTWMWNGGPNVGAGWVLLVNLGFDFSGASYFCTSISTVITTTTSGIWYHNIVDNVTDAFPSSDGCSIGIFNADARWYANWVLGCSSSCGTAAPIAWLTQSSMGANLTGAQFELDVDFYIPMPPVGQQPPGNLTWECDTDTGTGYDFGIVLLSSTRWLGDACDGVGTYVEPISVSDVVNGIITVKLTDNGSLVGLAPNIAIDVLKASSITTPWIMSRENLGWLIYLVLISMGVLLSCYAVYRWRTGE